MREDQFNEEARCQLDAEQSVLDRLGSTLTLLPITFFAVLWYAALGHCADPWVRIPLRIAAETLILFCAVALLYVWWRPPWLKRLYLKVERKVGYLLAAVVLVGFLSLGAAIVVLLVA